MPYLVRPVPFPDADRLVRVWLSEPGVDPRLSLSIPESREIRALPAFEAVIATARVRAVFTTAGGGERVRGEAVDAGYFDLLGLEAARGRLLESHDHASDAPLVVVLSDGLWRRAYGASVSAVGSTFRTARAVYTVVGVAPRTFTGTVEDDAVEFWIPLEQYEPRQLIRDRDARATWILGRLRPHAFAAAEAQVAALASEWHAREPERYRSRTLRVEPFGESWRRGFRQGTGALAGAAGVLLAIAALNVGCLLLARVLDRRREFAVRTALGASRQTILRQLVGEALLMCAGGGLIGFAAGPAILRAFLATASVALPGYVTLAPDAVVAATALAVLFVSALLAGSASALVGSDLATADGMRMSGRGTIAAPRERRWIGLLIVSETALTLVLLVSGSLLLRSYDRLATVDLGYRREGIARLAVTFTAGDAGPEASRPALYERLEKAVAAVPGVTSVGLVSPTLPPWDADRTRVRFDELDRSADGTGQAAGLHAANAGLFPTLGIPIVAGRGFVAAEPAPVAIVSRSLADRMGGLDVALGRTVELLQDPALMSGVWGRFRVIGVAENVAYDGLVEQDTRRLIHAGGDADPWAGRWDVYVPLSRTGQTIVSIAASTSGQASSLIDPIRRAVASIAPASAIHWTGTMAEDVALEYAPARFYSVLVTAFSTSAMLLTGVGLFALLWNAAVRRTGEMGLRFALGAPRRSVAWLILSAGLRPTLTGAAAGTGRALGGRRLQVDALRRAGDGSGVVRPGTDAAGNRLGRRRAAARAPCLARRPPDRAADGMTRPDRRCPGNLDSSDISLFNIS